MKNDPPNLSSDPAALRLLFDEQLVHLLLAGSQDAMAEIFERYYRMVMRVALHIVHDTGEAQDIVQAVFTEFYQKAALFDPGKVV
ncbi:MAG TPA: sigma factor [Terriglobales bacterium]|nr:sigma factor [Terriglobales bacterium]